MQRLWSGVRDWLSAVRERVFAGAHADVGAMADALWAAYWRPDAVERARLQASAELGWPESLRLLHLVLAELAASGEPAAAMAPPGEPTSAEHASRAEALAHAAAAQREATLQAGSTTAAAAAAAAAAPAAPAAAAPAPPPEDLAPVLPEGELRDLARALVERLLGLRSPFQPRLLTLWQRAEVGTAAERPPDVQALCRAASVTHLGALEVIRLDDAGRPREVAFVALADLAGVELGPRALFRLAKLHYEAPRERPEASTQAGLAAEVVLLPQVYRRAGLGQTEGAAEVAASAYAACPPARVLAWLDEAHMYPLVAGAQALEVVGKVERPALSAPGADPAPADSTARAGASAPADAPSGGVDRAPAEATTSLRPLPALGDWIPLDALEGFLVAIDLDDPRFEVKCRARGLDPVEVRRALWRRPS